MHPFLSALGGFLFLAQASVVDRPYVDFDFVVQELAQNGTWLKDEESRFVFQPKSVQPGWAPFREGQWVYTDYGWTWLGKDPGSWATGHYGRWKRQTDGNWVWVPGTDWLPATVEWLSSGEYIGWRPANLDRFSNPTETESTGAPRPEEWNFVPLIKLHGPLQAADFADREKTALLLAKSKPADHVHLGYWEITRPGPPPQLLKEEKAPAPAIPNILNLSRPGPEEWVPEGYRAYRPRFHQDRDGIFRRVDLFLNPRKENPEYQSVKETLVPDRKVDPKEQKKIEQQKAIQEQQKKHQEDLYR